MSDLGFYEQIITEVEYNMHNNVFKIVFLFAYNESFICKDAAWSPLC